MKIKKGDTVEILAGNDKGKKGEVLKALTLEKKLLSLENKVKKVESSLQKLQLIAAKLELFALNVIK